MEEHCKILDMTFSSEPAAFVWYNSYAREHGFSIRKDILKRAKRGKRGKGEIRLRRYVCSRAGKRQEKLLTQEGRSRRLRPETRCNCNANLTVKRDLSRGVWVVKSFYGNHRHKPARPDEVPFLRSHRKIKPYQRAEILSLGASGMRKYMIMKHFLRRHGYGGVGFVRRDLYNLCCREKRKLIAKGDAATALGIMAARKKSDPEFFFDYQVDDEGRLKSMFWCDSQSRQDYQDFGDVVVFDSTYKMNRYAMPFIPFVGLNNHRKTTVFACALVSDETEDTYAWLLRTFLTAMCQKKPKGLITDGDAAMILAIQNVLPDVWHRLCTWHIEKNMKRHLGHKSLKEFRPFLYNATSEAIFEERWSAFRRKWETKSTQEWLKRMYNKKRIWAAAYLTGGYFLGMKSNQRSESLNSCLHLHLDYGMTLVDLIMHYENAIVRIRESEAEDDCICSQSLPVAVTESKEIEVALAHAFSPANFYILQQDVKKLGDLEIFEEYVGTGGSKQFMVKWRNSGRYSFIVEYSPNQPKELIQCSCRRMNRKGLPCKHILYVLKHLKFSEIPDCCVLRRFSKMARNGLPARRRSDLFAYGYSGPGKRKRYNDMETVSAEAMDAAVDDPAMYNEFMAYMKGLVARKYAKKNGHDGHTAFAEEDAYDFQGNAVPVGDPNKVATRGAPKQNTKSAQEVNHPVTKNGRPLAFDERKTRNQGCTACGVIGHNKRNKKLCKKHPE
jgi:zinc finger SWIM domain-containing protein 3